jgi:hypothetical protein
MSAIYDPTFWQVTWNGILVTGFAAGTFLKVDRRTETTSLVIGADGRGTFVVSHDKSAVVEFVLRREVITNPLLSAKMTDIENGRERGIGPLLIKQTKTGTTAAAQFAALSKQPAMEGGTDLSTITWMMLVEDASMFNGSAELTGLVTP